jgi:hypothetical protein
MNYDEVSPITGNRSVIIEADPTTNIESRICMESGYTTTDQLIIGSQAAVDYENAGLTQFMRDVKYDDENLGTSWYPAFIQMEKSMLYCERVSNASTELCWKVARVVPIIGDEKLKYPVPGKEGEYFSVRLDVENAIIFSKHQFKEALDQCKTFAIPEWSPIEDVSHIQKD